VVGLAQANADGNVQGLAALLFTRYVFAFEVTSALLITAAVGAMVMAHVERDKSESVDQVTRMKQRFRPGNYPGAKPGPGVYANTMSVAAPARLPDGNGAERSISPILPVRELTADEAAPKGTEK
jgi:NADH-quinone oxidoreductase subunit J